MAYRRRPGITRASTFKEDINHDNDHGDIKGHSNGRSFRSSQSFSSHSSIAAQATRASSSQVGGFTAYESRGFWGILAQKAKLILEDEEERQQQQNSVVSESSNNPTLRKSIDKVTSSRNQIGASEIRRKGSDLIESSSENNKNQSSGSNSPWQPLTQQNPHESQLRASRDVAMATAAKAKLLLRELKTVKANIAFAKERDAQLEEENKRLRDNREKGNNNPADDDLIRLQLETLLAEKARLAHENSIYARENRFLREIVEYHQLTMHNVVYIDEVAEVNPSITKTLSMPLYLASELPPSPSFSRLSVSTDVFPVSDANKPVCHPSLGYTDDGKRPLSQLSV